MSTDLNLLGKALIRLGILLLLFIAAPILLTMGFKALDKFIETPEIYLAYLLIFVGAALVLFAIYFAFKTFKVLQDAIFNTKKN